MRRRLIVAIGILLLLAGSNQPALPLLVGTIVLPALALAGSLLAGVARPILRGRQAAALSRAVGRARLAYGLVAACLALLALGGVLALGGTGLHSRGGLDLRAPSSAAAADVCPKWDLAADFRLAPYTTTYYYDAGYRVTSVDDAKGLKESLGWDAANNLYCAVDRNGNRTGYKYDASGNATESIDAQNTDANCQLKAGGKETVFAHTALNDVRTATDAKGNLTTYDYDGKGNLWHVYQPLGKTTTYAYDSAGNGDLLSVTDPNGFATNYTHDQWGYVRTVTDPSITDPAQDNLTVLTFDAGGRLATRTDPLGHATTYLYDNANRPTVTQRKPDGARTLTTTTAYDPAGNVSDVTDAKLHTTHYDYDPNDNPTKVTRAYGTADAAATSYQYDADDDVAKRTDADALATTYTYDELDRVSTAVAPKPTNNTNSTSNYTYDNNGNRKTLLDPNGKTTGYQYDALDRVKEVDYPATTAGAAFAVTYTYDPLGHRDTMTDPMSGTTQYTYDALGRLTGVSSAALLTAVGYGYDVADPACPVGKADTLTYPRGQKVTNCYDQAYRMTKVRDWNGNETTYSYDGAGRLRTLAYPNNTRGTFTYDDADRLTGVTHERLATAGVVVAAATPAAGPAGTPATRPGPGAATAATPAASPAATPAPRPGPRAATPTRTSPPAPATDRAGLEPLPAGLDAAAMQAQFAQLAVQTGPFFTESYELDDAGNRTTVTEPLSWGTTDGVSTFVNDAQDRLTRQIMPGGGQTDYAYSPNGNRQSVTAGAGSPPTPYGYDGAKRLTSTGSGGKKTTYGYDPNGNQINRNQNQDQFVYNGANWLAKSTATVSGVTTTATYDYDGDGLRLRLVAGGAAYRSVWDVNRALPQVLDDGTYLYVYGVGATPLARVALSLASGTEYFHPDGLGSVRATTGVDGGATAFCDYDPFGAAYDLGYACPEDAAFAGQGRDAGTGWYRLRARQYDPKVGRFVSPDPSGYAGGENRYAYARNNPLRWVDLTGLDPTDPATGRPAEEEAGGLVPLGRYVQQRLPTFTGSVNEEAAGRARAARSLGDTGEKAAGIVKNTRRIPSATGRAQYRVPDGLSDKERVLQEVKNVSRLDYRGQLKDDVAFTQGEGYRFELIVRQNTVLSPALQDLVDEGLITLIRGLP